MRLKLRWGRGRFPRGRSTPAQIALVVLLLLIAGRWLRQQPTPFPSAEPGVFVVKRAVDGDTLLLQDGRRVRLIGVDTPETKHPRRPVEPFGPEASAFTRDHVEGRSVRLEFDKERRDRYGRILAYVYQEEGDWLLNEELIRAGLGRAVTRFPYSAAMKRRFRNAEQQAREAGEGIWSTESRPQIPQRR